MILSERLSNNWMLQILAHFQWDLAHCVRPNWKQNLRIRSVNKIKMVGWLFRNALWGTTRVREGDTFRKKCSSPFIWLLALCHRKSGLGDINIDSRGWIPDLTSVMRFVSTKTGHEWAWMLCPHLIFFFFLTAQIQFDFWGNFFFCLSATTQRELDCLKGFYSINKPNLLKGKRRRSLICS